MLACAMRLRNQLCKQFCSIREQRRFDGNPLAWLGRRGKAEPTGVQELSAWFAPAVERIANDRQTQVGQMNPDLMPSSGFGGNPQQGVLGATSFDDEAGMSVECRRMINLFGSRRDGHFGTASATGEEWKRYVELVIAGTTNDQSQVFLFD